MAARRLDPWTWVGLAVTATAAGGASAGAQHSLAVAAGWGTGVAWLLPGCVDTLAAVAARVWLDESAPEQARHYARKVALLAVAVSLALNAAGHAVSANLLAVTVPLVVAVGAVPAASLAAIVHLAAVRTLPPIRRRRHAADQPRRQLDPATPAARRTAGALPASANRGDTDRRQASASGGGNVTPMLRGATATERARAHWDHERSQGRTPTGAELARVADCSPSMGRKLAHDFRQSTNESSTESGEVG
jgi:hypothetical protein